MPINAGDVYISVKPDTTGFASKINMEMKKLSSSMMATGKKMSATITLPFVLMGAAAVKAASDLNESLSKTQVVFGKASQSVIKWSESAATAMGMTQQQALEAASTYGNLFDAMKIGEKTGRDMSMQLVQLASDLASFNNASPEEALQALRSGLTGETEPLKRFGVNLNQARIEAEALRLGLIKEGQELTSAAKAQATYSLILKDTKNAQGDFERTSGGLANQMRIAKASITDLAASIGKILMPVVNVMLGWLKQGVQWFRNLSPGIKTAIVVVAGLAAAAGPLLTVLGAIAGALAAITAPVLAVAAVVGTLIVAVIAFKDYLQPLVNELWQRLKPALTDIWNNLKQLWTTIKGPVIQALKIMGVIIGGVIVGAIIAVVNIIKVGVTAFRMLASTAKSIFGAIKGVFVGAFNGMKSVASTFFGWIKTAWNGMKAVATTVWNAITGVVKNVLNGIIALWNNTIGRLAHGQHIGVGKVGFDMPDLTITPLAMGGIVTKPTLAMVGEAGPEAVIPLSGNGFEMTITNWETGKAMIRRTAGDAVTTNSAHQASLDRMHR